ncbi:fimbrial protein [Escherichia coli]|nr:fimbrial protein [Escherichia coli]
MRRTGLLVLFLLFLTNIAYARVVTCTGGVNPISFTLPASASDKITAGLSGDTTTYRELYTYNYFAWGVSGTTCRASANGVQLGWMEYAYSTTGKTPIKYGNEYIFPTKIDGLGISFIDTNITQKSFGGYAEGALNRSTWTLSTSNFTWSAFFTVKVKLWKIPGKFNSAQLNGGGMLEFDDIKVVQALQILTAGDTWASGLPNHGEAPLANSWTTNSVSLSGGFTIYPGTCDLANKTVELGKFNAADIPNSSPWKDVSFTINCPPTWGYGGSGTTNVAYYDNLNVANPNDVISRVANTANSGLIITVYPRTGIIDSSRGIIGLRAGGAEGYGIQLAWGTASVQPTTGDPTSKVLLNQPNIVNTTNYGNTGQTTSQLINMAARYIRTTGAVQAGRADASIEVVASYD